MRPLHSTRASKIKAAKYAVIAIAVVLTAYALTLPAMTITTDDATAEEGIYLDAGESSESAAPAEGQDAPAPVEEPVVEPEPVVDPVPADPGAGEATEGAGSESEGASDDTQDGTQTEDVEAVDAEADESAEDAAAQAETADAAASMPKQDLKEKLVYDDGSVLEVRVQAGKGILPEGTTLRLSPMTNEDWSKLMLEEAKDKAGIPADEETAADEAADAGASSSDGMELPDDRAYVADGEQADAADAAGSGVELRPVVLELLDADGAVIEPTEDVKVTFATLALEPETDFAVLRVREAEKPGEEDRAVLVDLKEKKLDKHQVIFETTDFGAYGLVYVPNEDVADEVADPAVDLIDTEEPELITTDDPEDEPAEGDEPNADVDPEGDVEAEAPVDLPMPARTFNATVTAEDGTPIDIAVDAVEGTFPEGTTMQASLVTEGAVIDAAMAEASSQIDADQSRIQALAVDIAFADAQGNTIEPAKNVRVAMVTQAITRQDQLAVVHVDADNNTQLVAENESHPNLGAVYFDAAEFSAYALVYTVDFHYEINGQTYDFGIPGGGFASLGELAQALGMVVDDPATADNEVRQFLADVESVEFSSPELLSVSQAGSNTTVGQIKQDLGLDCVYSSELDQEQIDVVNARTVEEGDWALISLVPFDSEETLTVTMRDGEVWTVKVTDAHEIPDSSATTINVNKSYLICYESGGTYYLLKNDGTVDSSHNPSNFEGLNSTYCWTFNYVFEEKHLEPTLTYVYYLIRPIDNKSKTIALNAEGQDLVQRSNNNVAVVPADGGGFKLVGYNEVKLNFADGAFFADQLPADDLGVTVHIYEMDALPTYSYTVRSADETRGTVTVSGGTQKTGESNTHYYDAESNSGKKNAGTITATPVTHTNSGLSSGEPGYGQNKWQFDHWEQDGMPLDRDQYPATIDADTLPIPFNGSNLVAYFKQNPSYVVPDGEKQPSSFEDMSNWLNELQNTHVPLDEEATQKTAEVYDYENRIYRVDITSKANFKTFDGNVDMAFCMDVSNSMYFPSSLVEQTSLPIYQINNEGWGWSNKDWLDTGRDWNNPYYLIADGSNTATVFKVYYQGGNWKAQDASRETESDKSFVIGQAFETNWTSEATDKTHPFNAGDNNNSWYTIYNAGDNRNRFYYLNQSFSGATSDLTTIKNTLAVAGAQSPQVRIAYNTFNKDLGSQRQDFQTVTPITGIDLSNSHGGGTRPDQAFNDAQNFSWTGDDRYVIWITDGAPQGIRDKTGGESLETTTPAVIDRWVRDAAQDLKDNKNVKFITIGLSLDKVPHGKQLLYDLADNDKNGNKMFYLAEDASDLPNILRQITKTIMDDAIVYADVTDSVGEAFYLVDKNTGLPLSPGTTIDIEGCVTDDPDQIAGVVQPDGQSVKWTKQAVDPTTGWHGTVYVKAKEDLLGGNAVKTNGTADITATGYKVGDKEYSFDDSQLASDKLQSRHIDFPTPRVNVNELTFPKESTEWTVYLGTEVDPEAQLKQMYEDIVVTQVINDDGDLHYPIAPNSIEDDRTGGEHGTASTFPLAPLILELIKEDPTLAAEYVQGDELNWSKFLEDIQKPGGVAVPYHVYGVEGADSRIDITLTKSILDGEEADLVNHSPHATTVVNGTDADENSVPVEKYVLTVEYSPDYDNVLPAGQGGKNPNAADYHSGTFGTMYQGHAAGRETSTNTHVINVYTLPLDVFKTDESGAALSGATFKLYKADANGAAVAGLSGKYVEVATAESGSDGIATLDCEDGLRTGETYYLVEASAPAGYLRDKTVWAVQVQAEKDGAYTDLDGETIHTQAYPFNWDQGARIVVDGQPVKVVAQGAEEGTTQEITDGSFVPHEVAISFQHTVLNKLDEISIGAKKMWTDATTLPTSIDFDLYRVSDMGHDWDDGVIVPCTCTEDGVKQFTCQHDGCTAVDTKAITAAGHVAGPLHRENETAATCESAGGYDEVVRCKVCGAIISENHVSIPATEHSWGDPIWEWSTDGEHCYDTLVRCTVCGEEQPNSRQHHDHVWGEWQVTTPATTTAPGVETRTCIYDPAHIQTRPIPQLPSNTSITIRSYRNFYGDGRVEDNYTTQAIYPIGSYVTLTWSSWNSYSTTAYIDCTRSNSSINGAWSGHDFSFSGGTTVQATQTGQRPYNYSVTVPVTENMTLDLLSSVWGYYPQDITITQVASPSSAGTMSLMSAKSVPNLLAAHGVDAVSPMGAEPVRAADAPAAASMTQAELTTYLDGLPSKADATCAGDESASHAYKEKVDTYTMTPDDQGRWNWSAGDLPKYNEYGNPYTYYVVETGNTAGYEITYTGQDDGLQNGGQATINNKELKGSLNITKAVSAPDGLSASVADGTYTFEIWNADGTSQIITKPDGSAIGTLQIEVADGVANPSVLTVDGLTAGTYVVKETGSTNTATMIDTSVAGYDATLGGIPVIVSAGDTQGVKTAAFTNKYETTSATVKKEWVDENSDRRPESLVVTLVADGEATGQTVTLTSQNNWQDTIDNLPKYKNGVEIDYSWHESDMPPGYHLTGSSENGTITTLTNTLSQYDLKTSYVGVKSWSDDGNKYNTRPSELVVTLYADGQPLDLKPTWVHDDVTNQWTYTFDNLPVFTETGTVISYTAQETVPGGYTKTSQTEAPTMYTFGSITYESGQDRITPDHKVVWKLGSLIDLSFVAVKPTANGDVVVWTHRTPTPTEVDAIKAAIQGGALPGCQNRNIVFYSGTGDVHTPHGDIHVTYDQANLGVTLDFGAQDVWSQFIVGQFNQNNSSSYNIGTTAFANELQTVGLEGTKTWDLGSDEIPADPILTLTRTVTTAGEGGAQTTSAPEVVTVQEGGQPVHPQPTWTGEGATRTFTYTGLPKCDSQGNEYTYSVAEASFTIGSDENAVHYTAVKAADGSYTITADKPDAPVIAATQVGNNIANGLLKTDIEIIKVEQGHKDSEHTLAGAEFQLTRVNDEGYPTGGADAYQSAVQTVDPETGKTTFVGLKPGRYLFEEKKSPAGYTLADEKTWYIVVDSTGAASLEAGYQMASNAEDANSFYIENDPGKPLPHTGGIGTGSFTAAGALILALAAAGLVLRMRRARS